MVPQPSEPRKTSESPLGTEEGKGVDTTDVVGPEGLDTYVVTSGVEVEVQVTVQGVKEDPGVFPVEIVGIKMTGGEVPLDPKKIVHE